MQLSPLHYHVRTESGQPLGQVVNIVIEPDTQSIVAYHVKHNRLLPDMVNSPLVIHRSQVIMFTQNEMIVDNGVIRGVQPIAAPQPTA
jgi:uncharacterized protein YrrD